MDKVNGADAPPETPETPKREAPDRNPTMARIAERSRRAVAAFLDRQSRDSAVAALLDPLHIGDAFVQMTAQILANPVRIVEAQVSLWNNYLQLWQHTARTMLGEEEPAPAVKPEHWDQAELFDFVKQCFLLTARWIQAVLRADAQAGGTLGAKHASTLELYTRQFVEAMIPADFFAANPDLLDAVVASRGDTLIRGLDHLLAVLERGKADLAGRTETSRRRATTPGQAVFRNRSMELLHYAPSTGTVYKTPLLIVPPWNARHHLLDLAPAASLIKWAVDHRHSVFVLSWAPPEDALAGRDFADTLSEGPLAALEAIAAATGERRVNGLGFGLGGTLLAATLGALAARGEDRFASATYLGSLIDFSSVGALSVFVNEETTKLLAREKERDSGQRGDSADQPGATSVTIDLLRANDIIWSFVVDCLRDASTPLPFTALRWNADSLSPVTAMEDFHLRAFYQRNLLVEPGGILLHDTPIDLGGITAPAYLLAGREDHLSPWRSVFAATRLFSGPVRFVLTPSGQAGSILSAPGARPRGFWTNERRTKDAQSWLDTAIRQAGSWWDDWGRWVAPLSGPLVAADRPGLDSSQPRPK